MRLTLFFIVSLFSCALFAEVDFDKQEIQQRIAPIGQVTVQEEGNAPDAASEQLKTKQELVKKEEPGQAIYEQYCVVCHRDGLAGAPKFRNKDEWAPRLSSKQLEGLLTSVKKGLNAMPANGTCSGCSDEDLKLAIQYMLPKS